MFGAIDAYTGLKFVHVLAAVVWVGGAVATNIIGTRIRATGDGTRLAAFGRDTEWLGTHLYLPASLVVLVFGILTALKGHYSFGKPWLLIGIAGVVATAITGSAFLGPELKRIAGVVDARGANDPEAVRRLSRLIAVARIDLVVLLFVIFAMVTKIGG